MTSEASPSSSIGHTAQNVDFKKHGLNLQVTPSHMCKPEADQVFKETRVGTDPSEHVSQAPSSHMTTVQRQAELDKQPSPSIKPSKIDYQYFGPRRSSNPRVSLAAHDVRSYNSVGYWPYYSTIYDIPASPPYNGPGAANTAFGSANSPTGSYMTPRIDNTEGFLSTVYQAPNYDLYGSYNNGCIYSGNGKQRAKAFTADAVKGYGSHMPSSAYAGGEGGGHFPSRQQRIPHDDAKAMWVGNLPPNVTENEIREYFNLCDIISIANLTRSRCAFINLTSQAEVDMAVKTYNDSIFDGCMLVCRSRKNHLEKQRSSTEMTRDPTAPQQNVRKPNTIEDEPASAEGRPRYKFEERFFILKSLTKDDLEIAKERGYWATQVKNEPILNKAFGNTRNVYLIFSANKSGEFYGYASIDPAQAESVEWVPVTNPPPHRSEAPFDSPPFSNSDESWPASDEYQPPKWGTPFKVNWMIIHPLPFSRVKHLRNAWNANKQVKVSRDGIEVETSIGKRLLQEFEDEVRRSEENNYQRELHGIGREGDVPHAESGSSEYETTQFTGKPIDCAKVPQCSDGHSPRPNKKRLPPLQPLKTNGLSYDALMYSPTYVPTPTYDTACMTPTTPASPYSISYWTPSQPPLSPQMIPWSPVAYSAYYPQHMENGYQVGCGLESFLLSIL
ncbi:hypothetical protein SpCBS45565_g04818 [Spizellomyces sp. 'palustris']|nr:hypothetical protein SpCBS45565_g04818 [Spizellomyces sp. 'palustris']